MDNKDFSYLLRFGDADRERLDVLAEIYDEGSRLFLDVNVPADALTIIDVGCGHGQITCWLGKRFARANVVGLDMSDEQLTICGENKIKNDSFNVSFKLYDILSAPLSTLLADVVYCRYLLLHVKDWSTFFKNVLVLCKPGGSILIEEPGFPFFSYPRSESLERANALGQRLTAQLGLRFDCIDPLWRYVNELDGVKVSGYSFSQPIVATQNKKSLLWRSFLQIKGALIATGLSTEHETDSILADLQGIADDPRYLVGSLRMIQLHLKRT